MRFMESESIKEHEIESQIIVDEIKKEAIIDRNETCFAGLGKIHTTSLTADPRDAQKLRNQNYW